MRAAHPGIENRTRSESEIQDAGAYLAGRDEASRADLGQTRVGENRPALDR